MFSKRSKWELEENKLALAVERLKSGKDVFCDLTVSNPSKCGFSSYPDEILPAFSSEKNLSYDPSPAGMPEAREVICGYYRSRNVDVTKERIVLTSSTSEAYTFLFRVLADSGDTVLFPRPSYPLFRFIADLNDLEYETYPLVYNGGWRADFCGVNVLGKKDTKAVVLVNPNNPTGSFFGKQDVESINRNAPKGIPIISDEVFQDFVLDESGARYSLAGNKDNLTFVLGGISKTLALPQMKLSWIAVSGPDGLVEDALARLGVVADTYLSVNTPAQNALGKWWSCRERIQGEIISRLKNNRAVLEDVLRSCEGAEVLKAQGGWYSVVRLPQFVNEEEFVLHLAEAERVVVHPGYFYDFDEEPYIVVSLLVKEEVFKEGLLRVASCVKKFQFKQ